MYVIIIECDRTKKITYLIVGNATYERLQRTLPIQAFLRTLAPVNRV